MLVITRKIGEKLIVGNEIEIQVLRIGSNHIRIGIKAPEHISVYRDEVYQAIKNEKESAVSSQLPVKQIIAKLSKQMTAGGSSGVPLLPPASPHLLSDS
jgi:carbon storage regulator